MSRTPQQHDQTARLMSLLDAIRIHLGAHDVAAPDILTIDPDSMFADVTGQLPAAGLPGTDAGLLGWADTLTSVTGQMWHTRSDDWVHLLILGATSEGVQVRIYGAVPAEALLPVTLEPGEQRAVPVTQLRTWAASGRVAQGGAAT
jgi:hypothetical protein